MPLEAVPPLYFTISINKTNFCGGKALNPTQSWVRLHANKGKHSFMLHIENLGQTATVLMKWKTKLYNY